jgi:hypothetical protein
MTARQRFGQGKASPFARKRGLATRIQWQLSAPFQPGLSASFDLLRRGAFAPRLES